MDNLIVGKHLSILANATGSGSTDEVYLSAGNDLSFGTGANDISLSFSGGRLEPSDTGGIARITSTNGSITIRPDGIIMPSAALHVGSKVEVTAAGSVSFDTGTKLSVPGGEGQYAGQIQITSQNGTINLNNAQLTAADGLPDVHPLDLGSIRLVSYSGISSSGSGGLLKADTVYLKVQNNGNISGTSQNPLNTETSHLSAMVEGSTGGNINVSNAGLLELGNVSTKSGSITISNTGQITQASGTTVSAAGNFSKITLSSALGSIGEQGNPVRGGAEIITLNAPNGSIYFSATPADSNDPNKSISIKDSSAGFNFDVTSSSTMTGQLILDTVSAEQGYLSVHMPTCVFRTKLTPHSDSKWPPAPIEKSMG